jgi:hypothetical protein
MPKLEKVRESMIKSTKAWKSMRKCAKSWESMKKCAKSWKRMPKLERVWESVLKVKKVWQARCNNKKVMVDFLNFLSGLLNYSLRFLLFFICTIIFGPVGNDSNIFMESVIWMLIFGGNWKPLSR